MLQHAIDKCNMHITSVVVHLLVVRYAALLSLMCKNLHTKLRCSCNNPLGGLFSYELATYCL